MLPGDVRIDRQTEHGNRFVIGRDGDRSTVIAKHKAEVEERVARDPVYRAKVKALHGRRLFCWCHPEPCHGDTLACIAERLNSGG
jgi:hypothetical protein